MGSLTQAGFEIAEAYGDWQQSPLQAASPDIVLVAKRSSGVRKLSLVGQRRRGNPPSSERPT